MKVVPQHRRKIALYNYTKHDRVCKALTEIKYLAKNFQNAPRISDAIKVLKLNICWLCEH